MVNITSKKIKITDYTFVALLDNPNQIEDHYPRSWSVSGFDGVEWRNISYVPESGITYGVPKSFKTFDSGPFSSLQFTMTDRTYRAGFPGYLFCLTNFEIFGEIGYFPGDTLTKCHNLSFQYYILTTLSLFHLIFLTK